MWICKALILGYNNIWLQIWGLFQILLFLASLLCVGILWSFFANQKVIPLVLIWNLLLYQICFHFCFHVFVNLLKICLSKIDVLRKFDHFRCNRCFRNHICYCRWCCLLFRGFLFFLVYCFVEFGAKSCSWCYIGCFLIWVCEILVF